MDRARRSAWSDLRALVGAAWRLDSRGVLLQVGLLLVTGLTGGVSLLLLVPIVDSIADPTGAIEVPGMGQVSTGGTPLPVLLAAFVLLTLISALATRASAINSTALQQQIVDRMRQSAFEAILAARWTFVLARRRSDIVEVVTTGAARCGMAFQQLLSSAVTAVIALATAAVALWVSPLVAAVSIVGVLLLGGLLATNLWGARRLGRDFGRENRNLQAVMTDSMDSLRLVRAHGADKVWADRLGAAFTTTRAVQVASTRRNANVAALSSVGLAACASALVLIAVWAQVPPTSIVVILILVARLARNIQSLAQSGALLANALPAVGDLTELTREAQEEREIPPGRGTTELALGDSGPLLEFHRVAFTYPNSDAGLDGVDFAVARGDITVLTGPSGAGKSTCADLALGLLTPSRGDVLVAGRPLSPEDLPAWRSHVAYVPQETVLIPATLRENLVWSVQRSVSDDECWTALDRAAAGFARQLPDGLDTVLGDRGLRLSGGERQRIAIARALLRQPALLVLDEATSSLDDATEAAVIDLMDSLAPDITVLVVAHRRSTVESAHHVVRIQDGRTLPHDVSVRSRVPALPDE